MSTVILFGAGASISAGYPSAKDLFTKIGEYAKHFSFGQMETDWSQWVNFQNSDLIKPFESLIHASNPEIVLSILDLFSAGQEDAIQGLVSIAYALSKDENTSSTKIYMSRLEALRKDDLTNSAISAHQALLRCLENFFNHKSYEEFHHPEKRAYLLSVFKELNEGDTVITFNWDSTAERTLGEMGLWNPTTGYGIEKRLVRGKVEVPAKGNRELIPSSVQVLKLHGSIGWQRPRLESEPIYLDNARLLQYLQISLPNEKNPITFVDPEYNQIEHNKSPIIAPTFLKLVPAGKDMQRIWYLAGKALSEATDIKVYGYSLPPSDGAARVLLNPLRFREDVEITVTDPSRDARDRWDEFLGQKVSHWGEL